LICSRLILPVIGDAVRKSKAVFSFSGKLNFD